MIILVFNLWAKLEAKLYFLFFEGGEQTKTKRIAFVSAFKKTIF